MPEAASPNANATQIFAEIGARFNELRGQSMTGAWRYIQQAYRAHQSELVPSVIDLKSFESMMMEIEGYLKGSTGQAGKSPNEALAEWLNGGDVEPAPDSEPEPPRNPLTEVLR
jgi:hypothetical protein